MSSSGFQVSLVSFICVPYIQFRPDFTQRCLSTPEDNGDPAQHVNAATLHAATPLPREWAKATLSSCSWKDALVTAVSVNISSCSVRFACSDALALQFIAPRSVIYQAVCERLEVIDYVMDATKCFLQMTGELGNQMNLHRDLREWALGEWLCISGHNRLPSVRLQATFLRETGTSRRCSNGCQAILRGRLPLLISLVPRSPFRTRRSHQAKQGVFGNWVVGTGARRCKPGTWFLCPALYCLRIVARLSRSIHRRHGVTRRSMQHYTMQETMKTQ